MIEKDDKTGIFIQNAIKNAMRKGIRTIEVPFPVEGHHELLATAVITAPRAIRRVGISRFQHGVWSVDKQMIVWEDLDE